MSIINGIIDFTTGIENAVGSEVRKIGSDLDSGVSAFASQLSGALETQFSHLRDLANAGKADIDADLREFGSTLDTLKNQGETLVEGVFHDAVSKVSSITDDMKAIGIKIGDAASNATTYMRTTMRNDLEGAVDDAKKSFDKIENEFKTNISGAANDFVTFAKNEIDSAVTLGKTSLSDLDKLAEDLKSKLSATIDSIKADLEKAKSDLSKELDDVIAFAKNEITKLESRITAIASTADKVVTNVAIAVTVVAVGFLVFEVIRKNMSKDSKDKQKKLQ